MRLTVLLLLTFATRAVAQEQAYAYVDFVDKSKVQWLNLCGSFLEPNRFATVYDRTPQRLRLEAGYGNELLTLTRKTSLGAEILVWSGLKTLSGFRFPVETADYFFGIYSISLINIDGLESPLKIRSRLSHISSHYVDGVTDSVVGGSSSKYSREFVSVEGLVNLFPNESYIFSAGIKYVFHQVNRYEPSIQFPITANFGFKRFDLQNRFRMYLSTAAGPSLPNYAVGLLFQHKTDNVHGVEIYGEYHTGHSRYGVDADAKESGFEIGLRLGNFPSDYY